MENHETRPPRNDDAPVPGTSAPAPRRVDRMVPIIVDMGTIKRRKARLVAQGKGELRVQVDRAVQYVVAGLCRIDHVVIVPVVVLCRQKPKKRARRVGLFGA